MPPPATTALHSTRAPKPIYRHPLKPATTKNPLKPAITPAPAPKTRQGDPQWLRIMHTKENQWRLINTIALHELNLLERAACAQLDALAARLDALIARTAALDALLVTCRERRERHRFHSLAAPPLRRAIAALANTPYARRVATLSDARAALPLPLTLTPHAPLLHEQLVSFRRAAARFARVAAASRLHHLAQLADHLTALVDAVDAEPPLVASAAQAVVDAANVAETARLHAVDAIVDAHDDAFVPEPSFVE